MITIRCRNRLLTSNFPIVMGIINLTPDSFYSTSRYSGPDVLNVAEMMIEQGAGILDLGAVSTRPGAGQISEVEELQRLMRPLSSIRSKFPDIYISVDTYRAGVASECLKAGADIINDISGGTMDRNMWSVVAKSHAAYVLMHMKGTPETMQKNPQYYDPVMEIMHFFSDRVTQLQKFGINEIIIDPGFGFGKTVDHNYAILRQLEAFKIFEKPLLVGLSRKSMIYKFLNITSEESLNGTTALHMISLEKGADIIRTHDVAETVQTIKLWWKYKSSNGSVDKNLK